MRNAEPQAICRAIHVAECYYGLEDCEEKALKELEKAYAAGADVNARDEYLRTTLMLAARHRKKEYMEMLLVHGADAFARDCDGKGALQYMARRLYLDNPDMVQLLTPNSASHES